MSTKFYQPFLLLTSSRQAIIMYIIKRIQTKAILNQILPKNTSHIHSRKEINEYLKLYISGQDLKFPFVWLRDNCRCEYCYHRSAKSRTINWSDFNVDVKPKNVIEGENTIQVTWEDGHKSIYLLNWLKFRGFNTDSKMKYNETIYKPTKTVWSGEHFNEICSWHDYNEILKLDDALSNWLEKLAIFGVTLIQNTPDNETAINKIVDRIGFTKRTHYGDKFIVQHVANTSNVAYLSNNLQMHTDLPYYEYCPGVNMLHCLVQTESKGGENLLSDCHYVANFMKKHHPDEFKLLTDIEVEWSDIGTEHGNEFFKLHRSPIICLDRHREIERINFSVPQRGSYFPGPIDLVKPWYEAHGLFLELNHKFSANFKTKPGDILVFDNIRLLHGRNGYEDSSKNVRKLIGAYVDWDEIYSRLRCLKMKLKNEDGIM